MPTAVEHPSGGLVDTIVKVTGVKSGWIKGESAIAGHTDEIDVDLYRWGVNMAFDVSTGRPAGKRQHKPLVLLIRTCVASPLLYAACCRNEVLKTVVMTCRKAGGKQQDYMVWTLTNASICEIKAGYLETSLPGQTTTKQVQIIPYDEISFVYQKIQLDYKPQKPDGSLGAAVPFMDDWAMTYS